MPSIHIVPSAGPTELERAILEEVGKCLAQWSNVELHLAEIYLQLVNPFGGYSGVAAGFASIHSFDTRLRVVSSIIANTFPDEEKYRDLHNDWRYLNERLRKKSKRRNEIAHGYMMYEREGGKTVDTYWAPYMQLSAIHVESSNRTFKKSAKKIVRLKLKDIQTRSDDFAGLVIDTKVFIETQIKPTVRATLGLVLPNHLEINALKAISKFREIDNWEPMEMWREILRAVEEPSGPEDNTK